MEKSDFQDRRLANAADLLVLLGQTLREREKRKKCLEVCSQVGMDRMIQSAHIVANLMGIDWNDLEPTKEEKQQELDEAARRGASGIYPPQNG